MHQPRKMPAVLLLASALALGNGAGCAAHKTQRVETETVEEPAPSRDAEAPPEPPQQRRTTTTTTTTDHHSSPGVIGSGLRFVWTVIAFPFRVVGAALGALF